MPDTATQEREATELREKIMALRGTADVKQAAADKLRDDEKAKGFNLADTSEEGKATFGRIDAAYKEADKDRSDALELEGRLQSMLDHVGATATARSDGDPRHPAARQAMSIGAIVTASAQYKALVASGELTKAGGKVAFTPVEVLNREQTRAMLAGQRIVRADALDGSPLVADDQQLLPPVSIPKRMPSVLDLITVGATGREAVIWTRQTARTTAGTTTVPFGTPLNKSRYTYERQTSAVYRKGHYAVVDEGNIADEPEFQTVVNDELLTDLRLVVENDVLSASGGSDWEGILQNANIGAFDANDAANPADALHMAITAVRVALESEPTAWGISPEDFEEFYLAKGADGHYLNNRGSLDSTQPNIWGMPATISTGYPVPIVGDWKRGATLWVREGVSIAVDRIDDQFLEGLWTIRAQMRGAFAVKQPKAFCKVTNFSDIS